jgi:hypothetical protein
MRALSRVGLTLAAFTLTVGAFATSSAQAQTIPVAQAQGFMGAWTLAIDAQGQTFEMGLNITDESGNVAAEVSSEMGSQKVSKVAREAEKLVLSYSMDAQGQAIPVVITLTPADAGLNASLDFAAGMFTASGKGTKK